MEEIDVPLPAHVVMASRIRVAADREENAVCSSLAIALMLSSAGFRRSHDCSLMLH
jgi:hypothetical protein